jgi:hypothetical protein
MTTPPPTEANTALKAYHERMALRLEFLEWRALAGEMAAEGELPVEKQIKFSEITDKLVAIAGRQNPPINTEALSDFVGLDPMSKPHVKTRFALHDRASAVWSRIRTAWGVSQPAPAVTAKKSKPEETAMRIIGYFTAALTKGERLKNIQIADLVGCTPAHVGQVLKKYELTSATDDRAEAKDRYPDHNPDRVNPRASDGEFRKTGNSVYKSKKSSR